MRPDHHSEDADTDDPDDRRGEAEQRLAGEQRRELQQGGQRRDQDDADLR